MKASVVTVLGGLTVIGTVTTLYLWPSAIGDDCMPLTMTEDEIKASTDRDAIDEAGKTALERSSCLMNEWIALDTIRMATPPLDVLEAVITEPFKLNDRQRVAALYIAAQGAWQSASKRLNELENAGQPQES